MPAGAERVAFAGAFTWASERPDMGGLSAILMREEGGSAWVLTDKGKAFDIRILRNDARISGIEVLQDAVLVEDAESEDALFDSEGLAKGAGDTVYVSFEQDNLIVQHDLRTGINAPLDTPKAFRGMAENKGLEALAINDQGHLFTLAERPRTLGQGFAVWRWDGVSWAQPFHLSARDGFLAVSAEFGPDGQFYLLERKVTFLGFQSRLRRWSITPDGPQEETVLFTSRAGAFANLEGLSIWQNGKGQTVLTMVSDDNFWPFMRMQLVEYVLTE